MEKEFVKGQSDNLPKLDSFSMFSFFGKNSDFYGAEMKGVKMMRSGRENYGDSAIGYVQVRRQANICTVRAKVTPEHKVRTKPYTVELQVDEKEEEILSVECKDCAASLGGCKHAVALITWVHRRSEEPSPTSIQCYWKKAKLSEVGAQLKFVKARDIRAPSQKKPKCDSSSNNDSFLNAVLKESKVVARQDTAIARYFRETKEVEKLSLHTLSMDFFLLNPDGTPDEFLAYSSLHMSNSLCEEAESLTMDQAKNPLWFELRHARITASKFHEASRCQTYDGSLTEAILGASKLVDTKAMARGRMLEASVRKAVEKEMNMKFHKCGLRLCADLSVLRASADGLSEDHVHEIKCPSSEKAMKSYVADGKIKAKHAAQVQLQMHMYGKKKGFFCVAHSDFEVSKKVTTLEIDYDFKFVENLTNDAMKYWKEAIFTSLRKRFV